MMTDRSSPLILLTCFRALGLLGVAVLTAVRHHEDVRYAGLFPASLNTASLAELLSSQVEQAAGVAQQGGLPPGADLAEGAGVAQAGHLLRKVELRLAEVGEEDDGDLVALSVTVGLELV